MTQMRRRKVWHRVCAVAASDGLSLGLAMTAATPVEPVEAAWVEAEFARGTVSSGVLAVPGQLVCKERSLLGLGLGTAADLTWGASPNASGYGLLGREVGQSQWIEATGLLTETKATFENGLLSGLLSGLLGTLLGSRMGIVELKVVAKTGTYWTSAETNTVKVEKARVVLGLVENYKCR